MKILKTAIFFVIFILILAKPSVYASNIPNNPTQSLIVIQNIEQQTYTQLSKTKDPQVRNKLYVKLDLLRELKTLYQTKPKQQNKEKLQKLLEAKYVYFDNFNNFIDYLTNLTSSVNAEEKFLQHLIENKKTLNEELTIAPKNTLDKELLELRYKITQVKLSQIQKSIESTNNFLNTTYKQMNTIVNKIILNKDAISSIDKRIKEKETLNSQTQDNITSQNIQLDTQIQFLISQISRSSSNNSYLQNRLAILENQKIYNEKQLFDLSISILDLRVKRYFLELIKNRNSVQLIDSYNDIQKEIQKVENSIDANINYTTNYAPPNYSSTPNIFYLSYFKQAILNLMTYRQNLTLLSNKLNTVKKIMFHIQNPSIYAVNKAAKSLRILGNQTLKVLDYSLFEYKGIDLTFALILKIILLLLLGFMLDKHYKRSLEEVKLRLQLSPSNLQILKTLGSHTIVIIIVSIGLTFVGVNVSTIALIAGALSVWLGFGLQTIANNIVSGIIIIFEQLIKPGDIINLPENNISGVVVKTKLRSTIIKAYDNTDIIVPNSYFINSKVINSTYSGRTIKLKLPLIVNINSDIQKVKEIVENTLKEQDYALIDEKHKLICVLLKQSIYGLEF